jgi:hypothetical protein
MCQHVNNTAALKCWLARHSTASTELTNNSKWLQGYQLSISHTYLCSNRNNSRNKFLLYQLSFCEFCANQQVVRKTISRQNISYPLLHNLWSFSLWFDWSYTQPSIWRRDQGAGDGRQDTGYWVLWAPNVCYSALLGCNILKCYCTGNTLSIVPTKGTVLFLLFSPTHAH